MHNIWTHVMLIVECSYLFGGHNDVSASLHFNTSLLFPIPGLWARIHSNIQLAGDSHRKLVPLCQW